MGHQTLDLPIVETEESGVRLSGQYSSLDIHEYHNSTALSASGVARLLRSPMHYRQPFGEPSAAMQLGTAVHLLCLEGRADLVPLAPEVNRRTKAGKAELEEWTARQPRGAILLAPKDRERAYRMYESVIATDGLDLSGLAEQSFFGTDGDGCYRRARPDLYCRDRSLIIDLKTTADASEGAFRRSVGNYSYYRQAPWYTDTLEMCGEAASDFVFLAVESAAPYAVAMYGLDDATIEQGRRDNAKAAKLWTRCTERGEWPGYQNGVGMLVLPSYLRDIDFDQ